MWLRLTLLVALAFVPQGCARKDPAVDSLIGSEPQRLSFGPPPQVLQTFVEKMKMCWFSPGETLDGYRYEAGERYPGEDVQSPEGYPNVMLFQPGGGPPLFEIQFHKYNENTLIVTRNYAMSTELSTKVKRDIQLWALQGSDCAS